MVSLSRVSARNVNVNGLEETLKQMHTLLRIGLVTALLGSLTACKVSQDAIAASQQMTATASALSDYYTAVNASVTDTISLYELDGARAGIPYGDEDRKLQQATQAELQKRVELAASLAKLANSMATLTNSTAASDVQTAATALGNELIAVNALPGGSPIPDAVGKAGNFLIQIVQQHEEKKAALAMDATLKALAEMFEKEKPAYDSITRVHDQEASVVAKDLILADAVDPSPMLTPALKPYALTALPPSAKLQSELKTLALARLQIATAAATKNEEAASAAMLASLVEMSSRIHLLATEKPMPIRGNPFSLTLVENWAQSWATSLI